MGSEGSEVEKDGIEGVDLTTAGFLVFEGAALGFEGREASSSARSRAASAFRAKEMRESEEFSELKSESTERRREKHLLLQRPLQLYLLLWHFYPYYGQRDGFSLREGGREKKEMEMGTYAPCCHFSASCASACCCAFDFFSSACAALRACLLRK